MKRQFGACLLLICAFDARAANLLINADFSDGFSGWSQADNSSSPTFAIAPCPGGSECGIFQNDALDDCCGQSPPAEIRSASSLFYTRAIVQCVSSIAANTAYDYGAWMRITTASGPQPGVPNVFVLWYPTSDCSGQYGAIGPSALTEAPTWTRVANSVVVSPTDAGSVLMVLSAGPYGDSGTQVGMAFDGAFFGPSGTVPVELQSFFVD